jgi:hypothetical protein
MLCRTSSSLHKLVGGHGMALSVCNAALDRAAHNGQVVALIMEVIDVGHAHCLGDASVHRVLHFC